MGSLKSARRGQGLRGDRERRLVFAMGAIEPQDLLPDEIADDGAGDDIRSPMFVVAHPGDRYERSQTLGYGPDDKIVGSPGDDAGDGKEPRFPQAVVLKSLSARVKNGR